MINKITLELLIVSLFVVSIIVLTFSKNILERKKFEKKLKEEIELLKKEIRR